MTAFDFMIRWIIFNFTKGVIIVLNFKVMKIKVTKVKIISCLKFIFKRCMTKTLKMYKLYKLKYFISIFMIWVLEKNEEFMKFIWVRKKKA